MSDTQSEQSPPVSGPSTGAAPKKARTSSVGRIVIGMLLLVLAVEAFTYLRVTLASSKLTGELARSEVEDYVVTRESVKKLLGGREPDISKRIKAEAGEELFDVYYFKGLLKNRVLCVHYGIEGRQDADESQREMMEVLQVVPEVVLFDGEAN